MGALIGLMTSGLSGLGGYLIAAGVGWLVGGWIIHEFDNGAYEALQLADAMAVQEQIEANKAAADAFNARLAKADAAVTLALNTASKDRAAMDAKLTATLNMEGLKDEKLAACLAAQLPDSILRSLPR
jgi:hypothetical protein